MFMILTAILIVLFLTAIILLISQSSSSPKKIKTIPETGININQDKLIKPEYGSMTNDYYFSRTGKEKWDDNDFDRWFTEPDDKTIELLEKANDSVIDEITGAAP